jgi:hypothetical protein
VRFAPLIDMETARIAETAMFEHRNLVWLKEGITPYGLLEYLMEYDPAFTWAVWDRLPNGLFEFEWRERDTEVRYEIPPIDGFRLTGAEAQRLDVAILVTESLNGAYRLLSFWEDLDDLDQSDGRNPRVETATFEGRLDDSDWDAVAHALGESMLETSHLRSLSAQIEVERPVYDYFTHSWVGPDEIKSGYLCRVPGVRPDDPDTLNRGGSGQDSTVFRIVTSDFNVEERRASLDLNSYTVTEARALAALIQQAQKNLVVG